MATQKAIVVQEIGKPMVLVHDHPIPEPSAGQVQIKVTVAGFNPHDQRSRDTGLLISDKLPAILAKDVVGTVSKVGAGVADFQLGDRVMSLTCGTIPDFSQSGLQQFALADVENCASIPENISDEEAATLPTNTSSAFAALFDVLKLPVPWDDTSPRPRSLVIIGGGSNCGKFAVQLAKLTKINNITVVGGDETLLKSLGASHVIDRHSSEDVVAEQVREKVGDDLLHVFDAVNFPVGLGLAFKVLSDHRRGQVARLLPIGTFDDKRGHVMLDVAGNFHYREPLCVEWWQRMPAYVADGLISPTSHSTRQGLDADVANAALDEYRDGKCTKKPQIRV